MLLNFLRSERWTADTARFLCNFAYAIGLDWAARTGKACLFVHVPAFDEVCEERGSAKIKSRSLKIKWTFRGSFSAVSTPIFASKYSLESSWRDRQDLHAFAPLRPQCFRNVSSKIFAFFGNILQNFVIFEFCWICSSILLRFWWNFVGISPII